VTARQIAGRQREQLRTLTCAWAETTLDAVSLADLVTALAILGLVLSGTFTLLHHGQRTYAEQAARVEAQQSARIALERLSREIRQAGRGDGMAVPAISVAEPTRIVLHVDLDGDGVVADRRETITWRLTTGVLRREAGGGAQPIVEGVRDFTLAYRDERGASTTDPAAVRSVRITLTTGADGTPGTARLLTTTVTTEVRLRNR
jgi:type II secretory pathway component PulJ